MFQNVRKQAFLYFFRLLSLKIEEREKKQELFVLRTFLPHIIHAYVFRKMRIVLNDIFNFNRPLVYHKRKMYRNVHTLSHVNF